MRAAIISNLVTTDIQMNQTRILHLASNAVEKGARFIIFPEAAATGLINSGNPDADYMIAEAIPGPRNEEWKDFAAEHGIYFAAGLLEREGRRIFDSAVLYNPEGELILHYRRNDSGWHFQNDDSSVYCEGFQIPVVDSKIGKIAFLICGDLWNEDVLMKLKAKKPDYLLYLFARNIAPSEQVESIWESEIQSYKKRWQECNAKVIATNLLSNIPDFESIGGAWYIDSSGRLLADSPICREGILAVDLEKM